MKPFSDWLGPVKYLSPDSVCRQWHHPDIAKEYAKNMVEGVSPEAWLDLSESERRDILVSYYLDAGRLESLGHEQRDLSLVLADSLCHFYRGEIPATSLYMPMIEEVLQVKALADGSANIDFKNLGGAYFGVRKEVFQRTFESLIRSGHHVLPDRFSIAQLQQLLSDLTRITGEDSVLELAAGYGLVSRGLREKGRNVIATDDFSEVELFQKAGVSPSEINLIKEGMEANNVLSYDILNAVDTFQEHKNYLLINPLTMYVPILLKHIMKHAGAPRILVALTPDDRLLDYKNGKPFFVSDVNGMTVHFTCVKTGITSVYGLLNAVVVYLDGRANNDPKVKANTQLVARAVENLTQLRELQSRVYGRHPAPKGNVWGKRQGGGPNSKPDEL